MTDTISSHELMNRGGPWVAQAREYLLWKVPNADRLTWSSRTDQVTLTVYQIEELASWVAAAAINEDRQENARTAKGYENEINDILEKLGGDAVKIGKDTHSTPFSLRMSLKLTVASLYNKLTGKTILTE